MVTADVLAVVFVLLGLFLAVPSFQLVSRSLWPAFADQSARRFDQTPFRTVFFGLLLAPFLLGPALGLISVDIGPVRMLGFWWLGSALGLSLAGLSGLSVRVGRSLGGPGDATRPWLPMAKGAVVAELACLVPILGWFLLFPLLLAAGAGAGLLAMVKPLRDPPAGNVRELRAHAGS